MYCNIGVFTTNKTALTSQSGKCDEQNRFISIVSLGPARAAAGFVHIGGFAGIFS